jgi:hypothetical protein
MRLWVQAPVLPKNILDILSGDPKYFFLNLFYIIMKRILENILSNQFISKNILADSNMKKNRLKHLNEFKTILWLVGEYASLFLKILIVFERVI